MASSLIQFVFDHVCVVKSISVLKHVRNTILGSYCGDCMYECGPAASHNGQIISSAQINLGRQGQKQKLQMLIAGFTFTWIVLGIFNQLTNISWQR